MVRVFPSEKLISSLQSLADAVLHVFEVNREAGIFVVLNDQIELIEDITNRQPVQSSLRTERILSGGSFYCSFGWPELPDIIDRMMLLGKSVVLFRLPDFCQDGHFRWKAFFLANSVVEEGRVEVLPAGNLIAR